MTGIFLFLSFIFALTTIIGIIKPKLFRLRRLYVVLLFSTLSFLFLIIAGISALAALPPSTSDQNTTQVTEMPKQEGKPSYVFDVPSLIGKNVDEVREILGQPADKDVEPNQAQLNLGTKEWYNTFKKDDKELLVTFTPKDRKIIDFFISSYDPSGATKDKKHLLEMGNLKENDPKYAIEFVKVLKDPSSFTGIKVIPR